MCVRTPGPGAPLPHAFVTVPACVSRRGSVSPPSPSFHSACGSSGRKRALSAASGCRKGAPAWVPGRQHAATSPPASAVDGPFPGDGQLYPRPHPCGPRQLSHFAAHMTDSLPGPRLQLIFRLTWKLVYTFHGSVQVLISSTVASDIWGRADQIK